MSDIFLGERERAYRERSNNASMAGIALGQSFMCKSCKQPRDRVGRKPVIKGYSRAGYRCSSCVELFAAKSADKTMAPSQGGNPREPSQIVEQF